MKEQILLILENTHKERLMPEVVLVNRLGLDNLCYTEKNYPEMERFDEYRDALKALKSQKKVIIYKILNGIGICKS
jgi:hypothetical protein